jgi:hypothetical protein
MDIDSMVQAVPLGRGRRPGGFRCGSDCRLGHRFGRRPLAIDRRSDDPAPKRDQGRTAWAGLGRAGRGAAPLGLDREGPPIEGRLDRPVAIGPIQAGAVGLDPSQGLGRRMAVWVDGADRDDRGLRVDGGQECVGRRRAAAVVGDLEQVHVGQAAGHEDRIDFLLDVTGQQEPLRAECAQEDDRDVVDRGPAIRRVAGHGRPIRPEDPQVDRVEAQPVARREQLRRSALEGKIGPEGMVGGTGTDHARLEDPPDPVALDRRGSPPA